LSDCFRFKILFQFSYKWPTIRRRQENNDLSRETHGVRPSKAEQQNLSSLNKPGFGGMAAAELKKLLEARLSPAFFVLAERHHCAGHEQADAKHRITQSIKLHHAFMPGLRGGWHNERNANQ
jgi:hypothetical protein